jgi:hypothetical protein
VIAGAGSGKTNTLAHRVAHLIVNGPPRIRWAHIVRRHGRPGCSYAGSVARDRHLSPYGCLAHESVGRHI